MSAIIRLALRNGVGYSEFSELCKELYVSIAAKEYGIQGRHTNNSRVGLMTGIERREVKKILSTLSDSADTMPLHNPPDKIAKILAAWHEDVGYLDKNKCPKELPIEGHKQSFEALVKKHGGDIAHVTVLRELKRSHVVEETGAGLLRVLQRHFVPNYYDKPGKKPSLVDPQKIMHGSSMLVDHTNTIFHNLYNQELSEPSRFELRASNQHIPQTRVNEFRDYINARGMQFLTEVDQWLEANQVESSNTTQVVERLGVGLYYIQGENSTIHGSESKHVS